MIKSLILKYARVIKFLCSSLASFVIDYVLRIVFGKLFAGISGLASIALFGMAADGALANILARLISAAFNFFVNKKVVFKGDESTLKAALKYAALAFVVMIVDTVVNEWLLIGTLGLNVAIAKPITEVVMFFINYPIQKLFVYTKQKKKA